jgi:hypothetical protein
MALMLAVLPRARDTGGADAKLTPIGLKAADPEPPPHPVSAPTIEPHANKLNIFDLNTIRHSQFFRVRASAPLPFMGLHSLLD